MNPLTYMHNPLFLSDMAAFYVTVHSVHSNPFISLMGIEAVYIDKDTNIRDFKNELRWNELAFRK